MSVRSYVIQLQPGVGQAVLPDHRKMVAGVQYVVDSDVFARISLGARQNIIKVITVNTDVTTASGSFVIANSSAGINQMAAASGQTFLSYLTQVSPNLSTVSLGGFGAQGFDPGGNAGAGAGIQLAQATLSGAAGNQTLTGPDDARYVLVYNGTSSTISGGWAMVWQDLNNRYVSTASGITYQVKTDGLGTPYVIGSNSTLSGIGNTSVTTVGTQAGAFAGVALVNIPAGNFAWSQIEGVCPFVAVASGTTVGSTVAVSGTSNAGYLAVPATTTTSTTAGGVVTGSALANNAVGTLLTTPASGTNGQFWAAVELRSRRVKKPYTRFLNKN